MKNSPIEFWFTVRVAGCFLLLNAACSDSESLLVAAADSSTEVLAVLDGKPIKDVDLNIKSELMKLEQEAYRIRQEALERVVSLRLLEKEASQNGMKVMELLAVMVDKKVPDPTPADVRAYYERRKSRLRKPFKEVQEQVRMLVREASLQRARNAYVGELRRNADLKVRMVPPRLSVNLKNSHARGPDSAPITLVEFSDFQCPYCRRVQPTLEDLFEQYDGKIRWFFKDLPLKAIHPGAVRAAAAARCAGEQDKFWDYRDALFKLGRVTDEVHPDVAESLKLDHETWRACVDSGKYVAAVEADRSEAAGLGIKGTPAFLVNGILLSGAQPKESFVRLIEAELSRSGE